MIAKNYIKHPDALRFQCEMFGRGHTGHYPRIMRLMEVIFDWSPTVPQWVKDAKARAVQIVKAWKSRQVELFEMIKTKAKKASWHQLNLVLFPDAPEQAAAKRPLRNVAPINRMKQRNAMLAKTCARKLEAPLQPSKKTESAILGTIGIIALICTI